MCFEDAPEFARKMPEEEWAGERDPERIAQMLNDSAKVVPACGRQVGKR
jgi:hypothetical protein